VKALLGPGAINSPLLLLMMLDKLSFLQSHFLLLLKKSPFSSQNLQ
jgi:hypothetical protein